jgi:capsular exopolysaccharide synthesis family protein
MHLELTEDKVMERKAGSDHEEGLNKEIFLALLSRWYWFLLLGVLGFYCGYKINDFIEPEYKVTCSLMPIEDNEEMSNLFSVYSWRPRNNIHNHIEELKSYSLCRRALENLNWQVFWYYKRKRQYDLYQNSPYEVRINPDLQNVKNLEIKIKSLSDREYLLIADGLTRIDDQQRLVRFEQTGMYGRPFKNEFFHFTIDKVPGQSIRDDGEYSFILSDINTLTRKYLGKLDISLSNQEADLLRLSVKGNQRTREADFLNELCNVYIHYNLQKKNQASENTIFFIESQLSGIVDSLKVTSENYTDFRTRNRIVDLSHEGSLVMERMEEIQSRETMARMRLEYYQKLLGYIENSEQGEQAIAPAVMDNTDPTLNSLVLRLSELYSQHNLLSLTAKDSFPGLISLRKEIDQTRSMLRENLANYTSSVQMELDNIEEQKIRINSELRGLPRTEQAYIDIKREFDINNELYTFLLEKRAEAAITKASNMPDIHVLDRARFDTAIKIGPKPLIITALGLFIGLSMPAIVIVLQFLLSNKITKREEVENAVDGTVIGEILNNTYQNAFPVISNPQSAISESFRHLRTNLEYMLYEDNQKIISVHSSIPGEGKSFVACNLSAILARNNKQVLLIDGDLRKSRLNAIPDFKGLDHTKGLSTYLISKDGFDSTVQKSDIDNLSVVLSGPNPPNPSELLANGRLKNFLNSAKSLFDFIIIDNAPSFTVADSKLVGSYADINLYLVRLHYSAKDQFPIIRQIERSGILKRVFFVLNDIKKDDLGTYHHYGDKYGYYTNEQSDSLLKKWSSQFKNNSKVAEESLVENVD